jgi:hypothetical protein
MLLATLLPIGTVLGIAAAALAFDRWGKRDKVEAFRDLKSGTSPLHRKRPLSDVLADREAWAIRQYQGRNGRAA